MMHYPVLLLAEDEVPSRRRRDVRHAVRWAEDTLVLPAVTVRWFAHIPGMNPPSGAVIDLRRARGHMSNEAPTVINLVSDALAAHTALHEIRHIEQYREGYRATRAEYEADASRFAAWAFWECFGHVEGLRITREAREELAHA